jgi:WD40 repeat protein
VFLWDIPTRRPIISYTGHTKPQAMVDHLALSLDGSLIASAGTDGMVYLWPVPEKTPDGKTRLRPMPAEGKPTTAEIVAKWNATVPGTPAVNKPEPKQ